MLRDEIVKCHICMYIVKYNPHFILYNVKWSIIYLEISEFFVLERMEKMREKETSTVGAEGRGKGPQRRCQREGGSMGTWPVLAELQDWGKELGFPPASRTWIRNPTSCCWLWWCSSYLQWCSSKTCAQAQNVSSSACRRSALHASPAWTAWGWELHQVPSALQFQHSDLRRKVEFSIKGDDLILFLNIQKKRGTTSGQQYPAGAAVSMLCGL